MRKLSFGMNMSLDGYIAAPGDDWRPTVFVDTRIMPLRPILGQIFESNCVPHHAA